MFLKQLQTAMEILSDLISDESTRTHLIQLFNEYGSHESKEANYVKCLDLFDMYLQAYEYEMLNQIELNEFFGNVPKHLEDRSDFNPQIKAWLRELMEIRENKVNILVEDSNMNTILRNFIKRN